MTGDRRWQAAGAVLLLASAAPLAWHYLGSYPRETWQVDLEVYREGARALVTGFPLYEVRTQAPQFLPFTYPPFSAFAALPLLLAPFTVMGWVWTVLQVTLLWFTVGIAFRPVLRRFGPRAGLVQGALAASCVWMLPVAEGVRFGQVNAVVVFLCLWDVTRRQRDDDDHGEDDGAERWEGGNGIGTGLAAAIKLTPAIFWVHWAVAGRWRTLLTSVATAALVTVVAFLLLPPASTAYWTDALLDPGRLGPNAGTSNQSLRGVLLRLGPDEGLLATGLRLGLVALVLVGGFALSRRLDRLGEPVAVVAAVGLVAFLVSPVSWVHHLHWGVVVVAALLGDGRDRRRVIVATVAAVALWLRLPWWGVNLLASGDVPRWFGRLLQNSYSLWAVLALIGLWWLIARGPGSEVPVSRSASDQSREATAAS